MGIVQSGRVVSDDERGLLLWVGAGAAGRRRVTLDGRLSRDMRLAEWVLEPTTLDPYPWRGPGVLMFMPPDVAYSIWWFWRDSGEFKGWYINLEEPIVRWDDADRAGAGGVDTADQALDVWVAPDLSWRWKDEDEFAERTGHHLYWGETGAAEIRAEGERAAKLAVSGRFPFDGSWVDFRPAPSWCTPGELPVGWDRPYARLVGT